MAIVEPRLYIALYTDADVDGRLAKQIRLRNYDAISAYEVGNGALKMMSNSNSQQVRDVRLSHMTHTILNHWLRSIMLKAEIILG